MAEYLILHGSGGNDMWIPWLAKRLGERGDKVTVPELPNSDNPDLSIQLPFLLEQDITSETTIIGHSASCPLILSLLERIESPVKKVILVAGYTKTLKGGSDPDPILQDNYDLEKIQNGSKEFVWIVSDNDPWGCGEEMNRQFFEEIGGTFVIVKGGGHFGSNTFNAPLYEFPLLLNLA